MIDTPDIVLGKAEEIKKAGHGAVIRYIAPNTSNFPNKRLVRAEVDELWAQGIVTACVYEVDGSLVEMNESHGLKHAKDAIAVCRELKVPLGTIIYFAVDFDATDSEITNDVTAYFKIVHSTMKAEGYLVGVYGSGATCDKIYKDGLAHARWISGSYGWNGTKESIKALRYEILQKPEVATVDGLDVDLNDHLSGVELSSIGFWH